MKTIHRYILKQFVRTFFLCAIAAIGLFSIIDFMDRIDNILKEDASVILVIQYFMFKIPQMLVLMIPVSLLVSTLFTFGIMAKNSELTSMRASGMKILWLAKPVLLFALGTTIFVFILNETLVPYSTKREKEIYNLDIKQRDKEGSLSQTNIWWRKGDIFYTVSIFDSKTNTLKNFSQFTLDNKFEMKRRLIAREVNYLGQGRSWLMKNVTEYIFRKHRTPKVFRYDSLPLLISQKPSSFYDAKTEPGAMSFYELNKFIKEQKANGLPIRSYLADLYEKISFPFLSVICVLVSLPFALRPARSRNIAGSFLAGLIIGFTYYAVHSFSISMGRAELFPPLLAAWMANLLMGFIGLVLNLGAEAPS